VSDRHIKISVAQQKLYLYENSKIIKTYPVSTAKNGIGCTDGSGCTPLGRHKIKLKIGKDCPLNSIFVARRPTGEVYTEKLGRQNPERDWILTRILWLAGIETGVNRGAGVDTLRRFIYIHGTADTSCIGRPVSHGCIRMLSEDIRELFDLVAISTLVRIVA